VGTCLGYLAVVEPAAIATMVSCLAIGAAGGASLGALLGKRDTGETLGLASGILAWLAFLTLAIVKANARGWRYRGRRRRLR
jgi:hypothetical protein